MSALLNNNTQEVPRSLRDVGADRFGVKRPGYGGDPSSFPQEAPRLGLVNKTVRKIHILYVGSETEEFSRYLRDLPHIGITQIPIALDGGIRFPEQDDARGSDIIVIDSEQAGEQTMNVFKTAVLAAPEAPAIVLASPGEDDLLARAMRAGASACIEKRGDYFQKLLPVIEKEILVRDLVREKEVLKTRGSRLRQIVESLPVGIAQIAPNGNFLAINQTGLRLFGASNLSQVTGKNLLQLAPDDERAKITEFLNTVAGWEGASIQIAWKGLDGSISKLGLRGIPLMRDPGGPVCALVTINVISSAAISPEKNDELQQKCNALTQSLKSYEAQFRELQGKLAASEERCRLLEITQQDAESAGLSDAELAEFDALRRDLEEKLQASEESRAELKALLEEKLRASEESRAELTAILEEKLRASEESRAELTALLEEKLRASEESGAELTAILEEKLRASEESRAELKALLEEKLRASEESGVELKAMLEEKEEQLAASGKMLEQMEDRLVELIEKHENEHSILQQSHLELEAKLQAAEAQKNALQTAHSTLQDVLLSAEYDVSQLTERHMEEMSRLNEERHNVEQKLQAVDQHRLELQDTLRETEERLESLSEKYYAAEQALEELERQRAEAQNTAGESTDNDLRYQRLAQYSSVGVAVTDLNGYVIECNDVAARMFGYENAAEAVNQTEERHFRIYSFDGALRDRLNADGRLENIGWSFSNRGGRLVQVQEYATLISRQDGSEPVVERILMDLSPDHRREDARHLHKLESAGDLAAATVKSLQELCSSLVQSSEQLLETTADNKDAKRLVESIRIKANRGAKYADRFLSASQKMDKAPSLLNFNEIFMENHSLLQNLTGDDIDLQLTLDQKLGRFASDHSEVIHLISNIMTTARESLPLGGIVTIETSNVETCGGGEYEPDGLPSGPYVRVVFGIDGCAAQPERRNASVRLVIDRLGGWFKTGNDSRKGNYYAVFLPRVEVMDSGS